MRAWLMALFVSVVVAGCGGPVRIGDPLTELRTIPNHPQKHLAAMEELDLGSNAEAYTKTLHRMMFVPGYTIDARQAAFDRLLAAEPDELKRTLKLHFPRMALDVVDWRRRVCDLIVDHQWNDLTPALIDSWSRPIGYIDDLERAEYRALTRMYGEAEVIDVLFTTFESTTRVAQQGMRVRCWGLLHRLGHRDRLLQLVVDATPESSDLMLLDLQAGMRDLGVTPTNREEILWLRKLRQPEHAGFWNEMMDAAAALDPARRGRLDLRDAAILVAAHRHDPEAIAMSDAQLYADIDGRVRQARHYSRGSAVYDVSSRTRDRLHEHRDALTWGDLLAMRMALKAFEVPQVRAHLFDYADRDRADETTEYGGVLSLDAQGRFEVLEFPPTIRQHDAKFIASQAMFDHAYTSLFHFHYHAQRTNNMSYAGPGEGDAAYADATRANCLVLTFIDIDRLNVDFYRHGLVQVDLGTITRPASSG